jgi:hypothetical protein
MTSNHATFSPSIDEIRGAVTDEITALGGSTSDLVSDNECLFMRVVLPASAEVRVGDAVQAGVAVRAVPTQIDVYPYTLREVCTNGAIVANALDGRRIERIEAVDLGATSYEATVILAALRAAVRECASPGTFDAATRDMEAMTNVDGSHGLQMLHVLARLHREDVSEYLPLIFGRFATSEDRSAFGVMNAVTSIARDTADPVVRWSLEQIGGSMPAYLASRRRVIRDAVVSAGAETEVLV